MWVEERQTWAVVGGEMVDGRRDEGKVGMVWRKSLGLIDAESGSCKATDQLHSASLICNFQQPFHASVQLFKQQQLFC